MAAQAATAFRKHDYAQWFFWIAEVVIAIISGVFESEIYYAYSMGGTEGRAISVVRAALTQIAIVIFGLAAVRLTQALPKGWERRLKLGSINGMTAVFALQAVWFMRETALQFNQAHLLDQAHSQPVSLGPFGQITLVLNGNSLDPWLIAAFPLFQVALNWLGPIVCAKLEVDEADLAKRNRLALEMQAFKNQMDTLKKRGQFMQERARKGEDLPDESAGDGADSAPENAPLSEPLELKGAASGAGSKTRTRGGLPTDWWTFSHFAKYVRDDLHGVISNDQAKAAVKTLSRGPNGLFYADGGDGRPNWRGTPIVAPAQAARRYARKFYAPGAMGEPTPASRPLVEMPRPVYISDASPFAEETA